MSEAKVSRSEASRLLGAVTPDKAFQFYIGLGQPLGKASRSLPEFAGAIRDLDPLSVKFHLERGDFESWFKMIGDQTLASQIALLRDKNIPAKELRSRLSVEVGARLSQLQRVAGPSKGLAKDSHR
jgi:hypothetical protein